ncbi:MAG: hypothetical protein AB8G11_11115 [Saprospiraceae bacterium]
MAMMMDGTIPYEPTEKCKLEFKEAMDYDIDKVEINGVIRTSVVLSYKDGLLSKAIGEVHEYIQIPDNLFYVCRKYTDYLGNFLNFYGGYYADRMTIYKEEESAKMAANGHKIYKVKDLWESKGLKFGFDSQYLPKPVSFE